MDLAELRDSSRSKADEKEVDFITNDDLDRFINQGARFIHGKVAQRFGDDFIIPGTALNGGLFSTVVGTQAYALPATMKKLVRVEGRFNGSTSDDDWVKIERTNINSQMTNRFYPVREGYNPGYRYFTGKGFIYFRSVPKQVFQVREWFVPRFTPLVLTTDTPDFGEEYHDFISEFAAIQCLRTSGEGIFKEAMELFNLSLEEALSDSDYRNQEPEQMVITDDDPSYDWGA